MRITGQAIKASILAEKYEYYARNGKEPQRIFLGMDLYHILSRDLPWDYGFNKNKCDMFVGIPVTVIEEKEVFYFGEGPKHVRLSEGSISVACHCPKCGRIVSFGGTGEEKLKCICPCGYEL